MDAIAPELSTSRDRWFSQLVNDPRDVPFVKLSIGCGLMAMAGIGLYFVRSEHLLFLAPAYLLIWAFVFLDRFILMLHCTSHRILYKKRYSKLNLVIRWVLGPFFGETPETYFAHHMGMHHPENNLSADLSSTMRFRRDRLTHWLRYFGRFFFAAMIELAIYHHRRGNKKLLKRLLIGELSFWAMVTGLCFLNPLATLVVFIAPVVLVRTLMMIGNWGQHAFIDKNSPENPYRNSITCINTRYNRRCFNDGYHIHHHVKPRCHWSELPEEFETNRATYGEEDAIVFEGIDFFQVWVLLMLKQHKALARRFVQLPGAPVRNEQEVVELLHSRLAPIPS